MLAEVERAMRDHAPIVFLAWDPHPMNMRFDLRYLAGGDAVFGPDSGGAAVYTNTRAGYSRQCPNRGGCFVHYFGCTGMALDLAAAVWSWILGRVRSLPNLQPIDCGSGTCPSIRTMSSGSTEGPRSTLKTDSDQRNHRNKKSSQRFRVDACGTSTVAAAGVTHRNRAN
jgi:hypothetical protein